MRLDCGHEPVVVCAECSTRRADCPRCGRLEEDAGRALELLGEAVERIGLVRSLAVRWNASGGPVTQYLAGRILDVLNADADRLRVLRSVHLVTPAWASPPAAQPDEKDLLGRHLTLGEAP